VRHLAEVERVRFRLRFAGQRLPERYRSDAEPDGDFDGAVAAIVEEAWAAWREEVSLAEQFLRDTVLGFVGHRSVGARVGRPTAGPVRAPYTGTGYDDRDPDDRHRHSSAVRHRRPPGRHRCDGRGRLRHPLADDGRFRFDNGAPVTGRAAVRNAVSDFFTTIRELRHELLTERANRDRRVLETAVTYTQLDGVDVTLPVVPVLRLRDHLVTDYRVYVDLAPVYA
jgi:hypothetical protein